MHVVELHTQGCKTRHILEFKAHKHHKLSLLEDQDYVHKHQKMHIHLKADKKTTKILKCICRKGGIDNIRKFEITDHVTLQLYSVLISS